MSSQAPSTIISAAEWFVGTLRATAFLDADQTLSVDDSFRAIAGSDADQIIRQPKAGIAQAEGSFRETKLALATLPGRTDLVLQSTDDAGPTVTPDNLGPLPTATTLMREVVTTWLSALPPARRLAFGCTLLHPVKDRVAGYHWIQQFLSVVKVDPEGSRDFLYQINRPRPSSSHGGDMEINRLSRWSVGARSQVRVIVTAPPKNQDSHVSAPEYSGRLELDLSTSSEWPEVIPTAMLRKLMDEMLDAATEIAEKGDVP